MLHPGGGACNYLNYTVKQIAQLRETGLCKVIQKEIDRLKHLGIICKGLTGYSSLVVLVKWKNQNLYRVCSDFCILNEKLVKINHAFPLARDCIEQLGRKKCHYLSMIDHRDAFHTL